MRIEFNRKYNTIAAYAVLVITAAAVVIAALLKIDAVAAFVKNCLSILSPFIWGFTIAYILCPLLNTYEGWLKRWSRGRIGPKAARRLGVLGAYVTAAILLAIFFSIVIPQIAQSIASLAVQIPEWLRQLEPLVTKLAEEYDLTNLPPATIDRVMDAAEQWVQTFASNLTTLVPKIVQWAMSLTTGILNVIIGVIVSLYLLLDKERFFAHVRKIFCALFSRQKVDRLTQVTRKVHQVFSRFIVGQLLDAFIVFLLCLFFMTLFQWPYAMLISAVVGVTNVIPYFGPFIGAIPSILILLIVDPMTALWFGIFILILQQVDGNIICPKILGDSTGLSPFWVVFSITIFGSLLGPAGMFIGVPLFAVIYYLISEFVSSRLAKKSLPTDTDSYAPPDHPILKKTSKQKREFPFRLEKRKKE